VVGDDHSGAHSSYKEHDVRKGEQTRQEIIRKAAPIFNQKGYDGAALSDVMRATGLEGSFMVSRLQRNEEPLNLACHHLEEYLETKVRVRKSKGGARNS
jgi:hypothetical protein